MTSPNESADEKTPEAAERQTCACNHRIEIVSDEYLERLIRKVVRTKGPKSLGLA